MPPSNRSKRKVANRSKGRQVQAKRKRARRNKALKRGKRAR